jgi:hypothetical protein
VHWNRADRIIDAEILERVDSPDDDESAADADEKRANRIYPVTGAGDCNETGQESVGREREIPLLRSNIGVDQGGEAGRTGGEGRVE